MTTTNLKSWKGYELSEDFAQYVKAGIAESTAIVSKQTGSLSRSVRSKEINDGFRVYVDPVRLRNLSGYRENYSVQYALYGYRNWPPFHFISEAFMSLEDNDNYKRGSWVARNPSGRNGSGQSPSDISKSMRGVNDWLRRRKSQSSSAKVIGKLAK